MRLVLLSALVALAGCSSVDPLPEGALRVLYVGNSLTYVNDLPAVVGALAAAEGREVYAEAVVAANVSLEDHWNAGEAPAKLAAGTWDVVVLQQGPSTQPASQDHLRQWVGTFAEAARDVGTVPAVAMVWPPVGTPIERAEASYAAAAEAHGALLLPAGRAWRIALEADPDLALYGSDRFHPSRLGTLLAALAVYGGLFGDLPDALPADMPVGGRPLVLDAAQAEALLTAARAALGP